MIENRVSYEVAKLAKEKGFNELCSHYYVLDFQNFERSELIKFSVPFDNDNIYQEVRLSKGQPHLALAPTQSLLQKWLRENHNWHIEVNCPDVEGEKWCGHIRIVNKHGNKKDLSIYDSYEEVIEEGLMECLKRLNDK